MWRNLRLLFQPSNKLPVETSPSTSSQLLSVPGSLSIIARRPAVFCTSKRNRSPSLHKRNYPASVSSQRGDKDRLHTMHGCPAPAVDWRKGLIPFVVLSLSVAAQADMLKHCSLLPGHLITVTSGSPFDSRCWNWAPSLASMGST